MTDKKLWIGILIFNVALWFSAYIPATELVMYYWWIFLFFLAMYIFTSISQYKKYNNKLESYKERVLLNASEKWDFLYQDIWVPLTFIILILCFSLMNFNESTFMVFILGLLAGRSIFNKIILRNKLIVEEDRITYSDKSVFSEIEFKRIKSVVFDDNMGKVNFAFFQKNIPENNSLLEDQKILDADDEGFYSYEKKEFLRRGLFLKDWDRIREILMDKSQIFEFKLDIVEAVKMKY